MTSLGAACTTGGSTCRLLSGAVVGHGRRKGMTAVRVTHGLVHRNNGLRAGAIGRLASLASESLDILVRITALLLGVRAFPILPPPADLLFIGRGMCCPALGVLPRDCARFSLCLSPREEPTILPLDCDFGDALSLRCVWEENTHIM